MTSEELKNKLVQLRGEPIKTKPPRPEEIPCHETSDAEKLCKHPLVSVHMLAYMHEPYIRKAIEGVMMQQTDFEYELVIGEDCSKDKTREICFEYQHRYPDRIRVLWSEANVFSMGGSGLRVMCRCRGKYIAFCEGDDYWIDPLKLQKQVNMLRRYPTAGACFGGVHYMNEGTGELRPYSARMAPAEFLPGKEFMLRLLLLRGRHVMHTRSMHTSGFMMRMADYKRACELFDINSWRLRLGDLTRYMDIAAVADACFVREPMSVYRINDTSVTNRDGDRVSLDVDLVRIYFAMNHLGKSFQEALRLYGDSLVIHWAKYASRQEPEAQRNLVSTIEQSADLRDLFSRWYCRGFLKSMRKGKLTGRRFRWLRKIYTVGKYL